MILFAKPPAPALTLVSLVGELTEQVRPHVSDTDFGVLLGAEMVSQAIEEAMASGPGYAEEARRVLDRKIKERENKNGHSFE